MTPREVLTEGINGELARMADEFEDSEYAVADAGLAALRAAGFEVLPTALVDAVLADSWNSDASWLSADALRAYRAPVLLGQTEETQP